jgi:receptor protein-tyrosine kinase
MWVADPDLIATRAAAEFIDRLRADYNTVIIAAPPVLSTMTASVLSEYADGVLLLSSGETTKRLTLSRAAASLKATGAQLIGVVLVHRAEDHAQPGDISAAHVVSADP